jgi:lipopolysaccharide heptosyltransferase II
LPQYPFANIAVQSLALRRMQKFLVIQTAFIGDVVLATSLVEKLHEVFPDAQIDFLLRKGNESLLNGHPYLHEILIWDKTGSKYASLWKMLLKIRKNKYDKVINVQRFAATGFLTAFSGAKERIGFDKNPFSFLFSTRVQHRIGDARHPRHEIERNLDLVKRFTNGLIMRPRLYPLPADFDFVEAFKEGPYICVSPASVWFTKQYPPEKWIAFLKKLPENYSVYLLGAKGEKALCEDIRQGVNRQTVINLAGQLSFLQSAALMKNARMNYVNDSAPMHFASAINSPVTAVYCSTIPAFGFGPLSDKSFIVEVEENLSCRPCGLHGRKACPLGHFDCACHIRDEQLLQTLGA